MYKTMKLLDDRVMVERVKQEKTKGGLILPDVDPEGSAFVGKIREVGVGRTMQNGKTVPMIVKEGDLILYSKHGGTPVKVDDKTYTVLREDEILAVIYGEK